MGMKKTIEVKIERDGMWPTPWAWSVSKRGGEDLWDSAFRSGQTFTKDRARKKALAAKRSIEQDDVRTVYEEV